MNPKELAAQGMQQHAVRVLRDLLARAEQGRATITQINESNGFQGRTVNITVVEQINPYYRESVPAPNKPDEWFGGVEDFGLEVEIREYIENE